MSEELQVYVNGRRGLVAAGSTCLDAVRAVDPDGAAGVVQGERLIADSRGLPITADTPAHNGAIYRVLRARSETSE
jgi:hypothetical protein